MGTIKPLNNKVILKEWQVKSLSTTNFKLSIPDQKKEDKLFEVVHTGGHKDLKKGMKVLVEDFAGKERMVGGKKLVFVDYNDIMATL